MQKANDTLPENRDHTVVTDLLNADNAPDPITEDQEEDESEEDWDEEEQESEVEDQAEQESEEESEEEDSKDQEAEDDAEEEESEEQEEESEEEESEEEQEEEETEALVIPKYDDKLRQILPDREFNTNADYEEATNEAFTLLLEEREREAKANEVLVNAFNDNPRVLEAVRLLTQGYSDVAAFAAAGIISEDMVPEDDKNLKDVVKANLKREEARVANQKRLEKLEQNAKKSQEVLSEWKKERGISDARYKEFEGKVSDFINFFIEADFTDKSRIDLLYDGFYAKEKIQKAEDTGRIKGRNEKIVIGKKKKNGDGIPKLNGLQSPPRNEKRYADDFDRLLDQTLKDA